MSKGWAELGCLSQPTQPNQITPLLSALLLNHTHHTGRGIEPSQDIACIHIRCVSTHRYIVLIKRETDRDAQTKHTGHTFKQQRISPRVCVLLALAHCFPCRDAMPKQNPTFLYGTKMLNSIY